MTDTNSEATLPPAVEKPCMCEDPSDKGTTHCKDKPCFTTPVPTEPAKPAPKSEADRLAEEFGYDSVEAHGARVEEARRREAAK